VGMEGLNFGNQYQNPKTVQLGSINLDDFH
jgi:hypothetical protein